MREHLSSCRWHTPIAVLLTIAASSPSHAAPLPPATVTPVLQNLPLQPGVAISWGASAGATQYGIYRNGLQVRSVDGNTTSFFDYEYPVPGDWEYCVDATDANGTSAKTCATILPTPTDLYVAPWDWINDAFPTNDDVLFAGITDPVAPGTARFDTTSAYVMTGRNIARTVPICLCRDVVAGDSMVIRAHGSGMRVDFVFRILPGPGNYHVVGDRTSGLRPIPTDAVNVVVPGDASFWGQYLSDNGPFGSPGGHPAGAWSELVWNSARCDTAKLNLFPVDQESGRNLQQITDGIYASTYHEADPKYATLGILKNRCFLQDPAGPANNTNITCSTVPAWANAAAGFDGDALTKEMTKIIPDGLLTPGSHVEYFIRKSTVATPTTFTMIPDTNRVLQVDGEQSVDGHRWQEFSVLPDRWKEPMFGGQGMAQILYLDYTDRRGQERVMNDIGDSLGMTYASRRGAHNGWRASGDPAVNDLNHTMQEDPSFYISNRNAQAGGTWEMYGIRGAEDPLVGNAGRIGNRLRPYGGICPQMEPVPVPYEKLARFGPTPEMLRTYYRLIVILTGDRDHDILGPSCGNLSRDTYLLLDFLYTPSGTPQPRGLYIAGDGFLESELAADASMAYPFPYVTDHSDLIYALDANLLSPDFRKLAGFRDSNGGMTTFAPHLSPGTYTLCNHAANDVFLPGPNSVGAARYLNGNPQFEPYYASIYHPATLSSNYYLLLDGFDLAHVGAGGSTTCPGCLRAQQDAPPRSRLFYAYDTFTSFFPFLTGITPPTVGVPTQTYARPPVQPLWIAQVRNNPLIGGSVTVEFQLARPARVIGTIYDAQGRSARKLVEHWFDAGVHEVSWDGADARGTRLASGVYFVELNAPELDSSSGRKMCVLK